MTALTSERPRVGIIPYYIDQNAIKIALMIPSDAEYGGTEPQIAKGRLDDGESSHASGAMREGSEELGLRANNCIGQPWSVCTEVVTGLDSTYELHIFAVEVKNTSDFDKPHYETADVVWLTADEFSSQGRSNQRSIVSKFAKAVKGRNPVVHGSSSIISNLLRRSW